MPFAVSTRSRTELYFRVVPHLLRYTILDVDVPLPTSYFTPSKNYNGHPVDDYDD